MQISIDDLLNPIDSNLKSRIKYLNCKLLYWAIMYYHNDDPVVSDAEYDGVYQEYLRLIATTSYRPFNDMSVQVGPPRQSKQLLHAVLVGIRKSI